MPCRQPGFVLCLPRRNLAYGVFYFSITPHTLSMTCWHVTQGIKGLSCNKHVGDVGCMAS